MQQIKQKIIDTLYSAGCDEAGAGCGAGDLLVAAVILDPQKPIEGLNDSKLLSEKKRELLYDQIIERAIDYAVVAISPQEVDALNIYQARMDGFRRAVRQLKRVDYAVIDGNKVPDNLGVAADYLIAADVHIACVSAASILAKVTRDRAITAQSETYPQYGFAQHKGYLTKVHLAALKEHGPSPIHRLSYKPVKEAKDNYVR